jgi:hypothetical protein
LGRAYLKEMRKTLILASILAALALPAAADEVGAPDSAAGGVQTEPLTPPSSSLPSSVGPLDSTGNAGRDANPIPSTKDLTPGTGKFEAPNGAPCVGSTGFGSTQSQPGHKC